MAKPPGCLCPSPLAGAIIFCYMTRCLNLVICCTFLIGKTSVNPNRAKKPTVITTQRYSLLSWNIAQMHAAKTKHWLSTSNRVWRHLCRVNKVPHLRHLNCTSKTSIVLPKAGIPSFLHSGQCINSLWHIINRTAFWRRFWAGLLRLP